MGTFYSHQNQAKIHQNQAKIPDTSNKTGNQIRLMLMFMFGVEVVRVRVLLINGKVQWIIYLANYFQATRTHASAAATFKTSTNPALIRSLMDGSFEKA